LVLFTFLAIKERKRKRSKKKKKESWTARLANIAGQLSFLKKRIKF